MLSKMTLASLVLSRGLGCPFMKTVSMSSAWALGMTLIEYLFMKSEEASQVLMKSLPSRALLTVSLGRPSLMC